MRLTRNQLKRIILEEIDYVKNENLKKILNRMREKPPEKPRYPDYSLGDYEEQIDTDLDVGKEEIPDIRHTLLSLGESDYRWREKAQRHRDEYELERNPEKNRWSVRLPEPGSASLDEPGHEEEAGWGDVEDEWSPHHDPEIVDQDSERYEQLPLPFYQAEKHNAYE